MRQKGKRELERESGECGSKRKEGRVRKTVLQMQSWPGARNAELVCNGAAKTGMAAGAATHSDTPSRGGSEAEGDFLDVSIFAFFLRSEEGQKAGSLAVVLLRRLASAKFDATSCVRGAPKRKHPRAKFCSLHRQ